MSVSAAFAAVPDIDDEIELDDAEIHARAWAMVEKVFDSIPDRIVLLHAAAMLQSALAMSQPDPIGALGDLLADHNHSASDILRTALTLDASQTPNAKQDA